MKKTELRQFIREEIKNSLLEKFEYVHYTELPSIIKDLIGPHGYEVRKNEKGEYALVDIIDGNRHSIHKDLKALEKFAKKEFKEKPAFKTTYSDEFVFWSDGIVGNLKKAIRKAKYKGKAGKGWDSSFRTNAKNGHGTVFFVSADNVKQAKKRISNEISDKYETDRNVYTLD